MERAEQRSTEWYQTWTLLFGKIARQAQDYHVMHALFQWRLAGILYKYAYTVDARIWQEKASVKKASLARTLNKGIVFLVKPRTEVIMGP